MKKPLLLALTALLIILSSCEFWFESLHDTVQAEVDNATTHGLTGIMVYIDQAGKAPAYYTAGWSDRDNLVPADSHDLFKIASISKLYIAAAATKMIEADLLSLDRTLADYLPEIGPQFQYADQITLRMLIQHRSGLPNFIDHPNFDWDSPPYTIAMGLELALSMDPDFRPDRRYRYSNTNYLLLGQIMDRTLGYSHHQYIQDQILSPLGLTNTYSLLSEVDQSRVMSGYYVHWPLDLKPNEYQIPGGSMVASIQDVGIFLRALVDGTLFTEAEQTLYTSLYPYEHTGLLPGYQSIARYHPDLDAVVVQFTNINGDNLWWVHEKIYKRIIRILEKQ